MENIKNGQSAAEQIYQIKDIPGFEGLYACDTKVRYGLIIQISFYHLLRANVVIYTLYL